MNVNEISHQVLFPTGLCPISSHKNPQGSLPQSVQDISALGLRHVGYGIPTEFFAPFVCLTNDDGVGVIPGNDLYFLGWMMKMAIWLWILVSDKWSNWPRFITSRSLHPAEGSPKNLQKITNIPQSPRISAEVSSHSSRTTWCENPFFNGHFRIRLIGGTYHI